MSQHPLVQSIFNVVPSSDLDNTGKQIIPIRDSKSWSYALSLPNIVQVLEAGRDRQFLM